MMPPEIKSLCDELGIRIKSFSKYHYRLNIEEKGLFDYWPATNKIGPFQGPFVKATGDSIKDYILSIWGAPFRTVEVNKWYVMMADEFNGKDGSHIYSNVQLRTRMKDDSLMPFGKHKGVALSCVPDSYLLWLWDDFGQRDRDSELGKYIFNNLDVLKKGRKAK